MKSLLKIPLLVAVATMMTCSFSACSDNDDPTPDTGTSETDAKFEAIAKQYLDHTVYVTYKNLADETEQLVKDLQALKSSKTDANVKATCETFLEARAWWEKSEAFLYGAATDFGIDPHIDSWPLDLDGLQTALKNTEQVEAMGGEDGDIYALVGRSGAGKSTLLRCINGLTSYQEGSLKVDGCEIKDLKDKELREFRRHVGMIFQQFSLLERETVYKNVALPMQCWKYPKDQIDKKVRELLELVGINEPEKRLKQYPHELSGGMRQRVMIAIALACEPKLLIADEPTTALDVTIQAQILELMMELKEKLGMAIIMITHDLGVVASMCDRIAVMYAGRIVEYGTTDDIFYNPKHEYTKGLLKSIPRLDAKEHERLVPIEGTPIDLLNPPAGCPFAPRCSNCMKICLREMAPVTTFDDVHYTQCWMNQKEQMEREAAK